MGTAIPLLVEMLKRKGQGVSLAAASTLAKLATNSEQNPTMISPRLTHVQSEISQYNRGYHAIAH